MEDRKAVLLFSRSMSRQLLSGGKVLHRATRKVYNRAADALRLCAQSLTHSKSALGAKYRRLKPDSGLPKQSLPWLTILLDWSIACSATDKTTSNRASINTNLNSSCSASNGSKKKPNHSTSNSFPLSNFHHQFLERERGEELINQSEEMAAFPQSGRRVPDSGNFGFHRLPRARSVTSNEYARRESRCLSGAQAGVAATEMF